MKEQIERASQFLDELLAYGRERSLDLREIDLTDTIDLAWSSAKGALPEAADAVELERHGFDAPVEIEADQGQLTEVFVALFENALHELADAEGATLRVTVESDRDTATVRVEDDGSGIPDELRDTLFEPFVSGRKRDGERTGTGLGLAIADRIVDRHGGTLDAGDSELGGATFNVTLPRRQNLMGTASAER